MSMYYGKIVLIGDEGVGKTSLVYRLHHGTFNPYMPTTIGALYMKQTIRVDGVDVDLHFWDTAGQARFNVLLPMFVRGAKVVLVCFDSPTIDVVQKHLDNIDLIEPTVRIILVMTKIDQASFRDVEKMEEYALEKDLSIFSTSALSGDGVRELFENIARYIEMTGVTTDTKDKRVFALNSDSYSMSGTPRMFTRCCSLQ